MAGPRATTQVAAVIGDPVRHSLSPVLHNAGFAALGLDWVYVAFPVPEGRAVEATAAMRALGIAGLSVTMPHKAAVADAVDSLSPVARRLGAVNTVVWRGSELVGDNTDGAGFVDSLRADASFDPVGRRCLVVGAGGAARAVVMALGQAGAAEVVVVNRTASRGRATAQLAGGAGRAGSAEEVDAAELVVNATPVGMAGVVGGEESGPEDGLPGGIDPTRLGAGQLVVDLVYEPLVTPLLGAAEARGAATAGGLGMLVHQAGHAFRLWTGEEPPLVAMREAVLTELKLGARPAET